MDLLSFFHVVLIFFPIFYGLLYLINIQIIPKNKVKYLAIYLIILYLIPIMWSLNNNKCVLTNIEKNEKNEEIFKKFPDAPFLPLHFNEFLERAFRFFNIEYNNRNMEKLIIGINVLDFMIIWYFTSILTVKC
jgi:hypothetical protein